MDKLRLCPCGFYLSREGKCFNRDCQHKERSATKRPRQNLEHQFQVAVFQWARVLSALHVELKLLYAIPNGGHRHRVVAKKLKAEGTARGVPDIHLPVARQGFHGLWVEMKAPSGSVAPEQKVWHEALRSEGHRVEVCKGPEVAIGVISDYLGIRRRE